MSLAKKCDICGKFYEYYESPYMGFRSINGISFINIDHTQVYSTKVTRDCCPECMDSIKQHIESLSKKQVSECENNI